MAHRWLQREREVRIYLKYFLFSSYSWISLILILLVLIGARQYGTAQNWWYLAVTGVAGVLGGTIVFQQGRLAELKVFTDLFQSYNKRFERVWRSMDPLPSAPAPGERPSSAVRQYLDLCAEEYFQFENGMIPPKVWQVWCLGMYRFIGQIDHIDSVLHELGDGKNYYGLMWSTIERWATKAERR